MQLHCHIFRNIKNKCAHVCVVSGRRGGWGVAAGCLRVAFFLSKHNAFVSALTQSVFNFNRMFKDLCLKSADEDEEILLVKVTIS